MLNYTKHIVATVVVLALSNASCHHATEPDPDEGRIVINQSIDGLQFGDDTLTVIRKLGPPNRSWSNGPGGVGFWYDQGPHATMYISISLDPTWRYGVQYIDITSPYVGKTSTGIALGSKRYDVWSKLGKPGSSEEYTLGWRDWYYSGNKETLVEFENDVLTRIRMFGG
jgi:outer membrane protein assembly factor BamE (lipoprotein component of BamABCDE complex)